MPKGRGFMARTSVNLTEGLFLTDLLKLGNLDPRIVSPARPMHTDVGLRGHAFGTDAIIPDTVHGVPRSSRAAGPRACGIITLNIRREILMQLPVLGPRTNAFAHAILIQDVLQMFQVNKVDPPKEPGRLFRHRNWAIPTPIPDRPPPGQNHRNRPNLWWVPCWKTG